MEYQHGDLQFKQQLLCEAWQEKRRKQVALVRRDGKDIYFFFSNIVFDSLGKVFIHNQVKVHFYLVARSDVFFLKMGQVVIYEWIIFSVVNVDNVNM